MKRLPILIATAAVTVAASSSLAARAEVDAPNERLGDPATPGHVGLDDVRGVTLIPEPAGLLVLASGLGVIGLMQRRGRH